MTAKAPLTRACSSEDEVRVVVAGVVCRVGQASTKELGALSRSTRWSCASHFFPVSLIYACVTAIKIDRDFSAFSGEVDTRDKTWDTRINGGVQARFGRLDMRPTLSYDLSKFLNRFGVAAWVVVRFKVGAGIIKNKLSMKPCWVKSGGTMGHTSHVSLAHLATLTLHTISRWWGDSA